MAATDDTAPDRGSGRITARDIARVRRAAMIAGSTLPGAIGEIVARELRAYADFGYRFGADGLLDKVTGELLAGPNNGQSATLNGSVPIPRSAS